MAVTLEAFAARAAVADQSPRVRDARAGVLAGFTTGMCIADEAEALVLLVSATVALVAPSPDAPQILDMILDRIADARSIAAQPSEVTS